MASPSSRQRSIEIEPPNFTQIPNILLDRMSAFSAEQFKVLMYLCRQDFGWQNASDAVRERRKTISLADIVQGTGVSNGCVKSSLRALVEQEAIVKTVNFDRGARQPSTYSVNVGGGWAGNAQPLGQEMPNPWAGNAQPMGRKCPTPWAGNAQPLGQEMPNYKEERNKNINTEEEIHTEHSPSPSSPDQTPVGTPHTPENQNPPIFFNPPAVPPPLAPTNVADEERTDVGVEVDLQLDEDILQFVKNCYRQNRGSDLENIEAKSKRDLAEKIRCAEQAHGAAEFRAGLWKFLAAGDDWLRQNKWPIRRYLQNPIPYLSGSPRRTRQTHPSSASKDATPGQVSSDAPATVSGAIDAIAAWNEINPEYPTGEMTDGTLAKVAKAAANPDFQKIRGKVFEKAGKFLAIGQPMHFQWLFIKKFKDDDPNWMCLLEGKFDFLLQKKTGAAADEDSWARLIREAEAREAREAKEKS